jgi:hypothetical protein
LNKIRQMSPDKVNGKPVAYRQGDCFSVNCQNGNYLGMFVSEKFNKYYDLTFIEFYKETPPSLTEFTNGRFFGTRFGSWDKLTFAIDKKMVACKYVDESPDITLVCKIKLVPKLSIASYAYFDNIEELLENYLDELPVRTEKSKNAEKFPDLAFVSKHLILMKHITTH